MWLLIGYGNRLRGDDAAGPLLAEQLAELLPKDQVRVLAAHQLTPELVEELIRPEIDRVLFVDVKREQPESVRLAPLAPLTAIGHSFGHQQQPELLIYTAQKLYKQTIPGWLLTLPGINFDFGEKLSQRTLSAFTQATIIIQELVKNEGWQLSQPSFFQIDY